MLCVTRNIARNFSHAKSGRIRTFDVFRLILCHNEFFSVVEQSYPLYDFENEFGKGLPKQRLDKSTTKC